jgi:hypothetical protein
MYIYMTCQQNMRQEHDTKITNEYFENPLEAEYLLMSEPNRLSPEYKTVMLPAPCYEGFKAQRQLAIVLYRIKISADCFDLGLPNITDVLAVFCITGNHKIRNLLPSITTFQLFQFYITFGGAVTCVRPIYRTGVPLPSRCCIFYIFSTTISTEYFKHAAHSPFSSSKCRLFHNATFFWFMYYSHFT